ncbi:hypothetical protein, partial [Bradyrhizobium sp.]|uniref:hypothetical protein n=1 Tax=Bradyrhizobium sp. TaxID=376 RepID=UPI003C5A1600
MADEAFALSPLAARPVQPSEADYDAIREAFMETSRGRWFLGEYAKRNRNADTSMVLDAVARIEETLAAQRQQPEQPAADNRLPEALAAIKTAVELAEEAALRALDGLRLEDSLAPIRKGVRIIKEISWRWREIGADGRICDLIDSQVGAIEAGCGQIGQFNAKPALDSAFDLIKTKIDGFSENDETAASDVEDPDSPPPPFVGADDDIDVVHIDTAPAAAIESIKATAVEDSAEAVVTPAAASEPETAAASALDVVAVSTVEERVETARAPVETAEAPVEATRVTPAPAEVSWQADKNHDFAVHDAEVHHAGLHGTDGNEADTHQVDARDAETPDASADAHDEAVLKLVAIEMAAVDPAAAEEHPLADDEDLYVSTRPLIEPMV